MHSEQVKRFYEAIFSWPKDEVSLDASVLDLHLFLEAPSVLLCLYAHAQFADGVMRMVSEEKSFRSVEPELAKWVRARIAKEEFSFLSFTLMAEEQVLWGRETESVQYVIAGRISSQGWILAGYKKQPMEADLFCVQVAVRHFASLAAISDLESAIAVRDQFLSIASHELKTPLTSIYGVLQLQERMLQQHLVLNSSSDIEKQRSFFQIVIKQVERLNELIDGLLDVSRLRIGRFKVEPVNVDVASILRETVNFRLVGIANESGVRIIVDAPSTLDGWVDPIRFEEVITNLGMNAIRFSPEGGTVRFLLQDGEGDFTLLVRDQGPAVNQADREKIFEPFRFMSQTGRLGGLGLGLFISRQITLLHGGRLTLFVNGSPQGNTFEAHFPKIQKQVVTLSSSQAS